MHLVKNHYENLCLVLALVRQKLMHLFSQVSTNVFLFNNQEKSFSSVRYLSTYCA